MTATAGQAAAIVAVDGGNSKTHVAIVAGDGAILGVGKAGGSCHQTVEGGIAGALATISSGIAAAELDAGLDAGASREAKVGVFCLAGIDLPIDERRVRPVLVRAGVAERVVLLNDTFATLRAGASAGWGVGVVAGAGSNCAAIGPDGRHVRFPGLGPLSGDRSGGGFVGREGFAAAIRGRDGRGPRTVLERTVPAFIGKRSPSGALEAIYTGEVDEDRLRDLAPVVVAAALAGDAVARGILDAAADDIVAMAVAAIRRLHLTRRRVEVVLSGGLFRAEDPAFHDRIRAGLGSLAPQAMTVVLASPPVLGSVLLGVDELHLGREVEERIRRELTARRLAAV